MSKIWIGRDQSNEMLLIVQCTCKTSVYHDYQQVTNNNGLEHEFEYFNLKKMLNIQHLSSYMGKVLH